jgi:hypothetical protein
MHVFDLIAGVASILGLGFSVGAMVQATRASTAAREARDGILLRTVADELDLACAKMDQLLDFLIHDRFSEAAMRLHELTGALSEIPFRRWKYLTEERRNDLLNARTQLQIVEQEIHKGTSQQLTEKRKGNMVDTCRRCSVTLRENLGTMKAEVDRGGSNE